MWAPASVFRFEQKDAKNTKKEQIRKSERVGPVGRLACFDSFAAFCSMHVKRNLCRKERTASFRRDAAKAPNSPKMAASKVAIFATASRILRSSARCCLAPNSSVCEGGCANLAMFARLAAKVAKTPNFPVSRWPSS